MKEKELRKLAKCSNCERPIGETGIPLFYKVVVSRYGLNTGAIKRQAGLEMMLGSVRIAQEMSPNEELAEKIMEEKTLMICEECSSEKIVLGRILHRGE